MPTRMIQKIAFDTGSGTQTINTNLDGIDLSRADALRLELVCTKADTDAGDTLDVYLQSRGEAGFWEDRVHFTQLTGNLSPTSTAPEILVAILQQFGSLSDDEEESEPSGSAGASRLAAGTVRNGIFPGVYRTSTGVGASWRVQFDVTDANSNGDFEGTLYIYAQTPDLWKTL